MRCDGGATRELGEEQALNTKGASIGTASGRIAFRCAIRVEKELYRAPAKSPVYDAGPTIGKRGPREARRGPGLSRPSLDPAPTPVEIAPRS